MILLVSGATRTVRSDTVGHLIVPRQWNDPVSLDLQAGRGAMDNGAWSGFDEGAFVRMLEAYQPYQPYQAYQAYQGCVFVAAPDVVADAASTLRRWPFWARLIRGLGFPPAFVAQDGLSPERVPWDDITTATEGAPRRGALFIGGSTTYKESAHVRTLMAYAKSKGVWTHWGRVNGKRRYEMALKAGCDSFDGSGFSKWPDTNVPLVDKWHAEIQRQPEFTL
jgi:hypothetical protein